MNKTRADELIPGTQMTRGRHRFLEFNLEEKLTKEEVADGWHFCNSEWDGMLIHITSPEFEGCKCDGIKGKNPG